MIRPFFILSLSLLAAVCAQAELTLTPDTPWIVSNTEPEAVQRALDDVAADWYKVLGYPPVILHEPPKDWQGPVVYLGLQGEWLKDLVKEPWAGKECFVLRVAKDAAGRSALVYGWHNQLSEMIRPERIYREVGRFARAGATRFFLVNLSDVRPVPLTTDCVMKLVWDASPYLDRSPKENAAAFYLDWSRRQFGDAVAADVAALYAGYFDLPYHMREMKRPYPLSGDAWFHRTVRIEHQALAKLLKENTALPAAAVERARETLKVFEASRESLERLDDEAARLEPRIPAGRRDFYRGHLRVQLGLHRHSNEMAAAHARAILAMADGKNDEALAEMQAALVAAEAAIEARRMGEYGRWRDWYRGDWLVSFPVTRDILRTNLALMKGETPPPVRDFKGWPEI